MTGDEFIRRARKYARKNGLSFEIDRSAGKGDHVLLFLDGKRTTISDRGELRIGTLNAMFKQLGLKPGAF